MRIEACELPPIGTNAFLLVDTERAECVVVDAPEGAHRWAVERAGTLDCRITALILTHGHWDHTLDAHLFAADGVPVYGHPADRMLFEEPQCMGPYAMPGLDLRPAGVSRWLEAGEPLELLGRSMEIRHVPGHCPGNILLHLPEAQAALVGDVIFAGSVGRSDLPGGDMAVLERSIREQVYTLPGETVLHPGHGPRTTVDAEKAGNPFVRP